MDQRDLTRRLRFRASLFKIGIDGLVGVARDRATAYRYALTGRETAPLTDFDPFARETMLDPYPGYRTLLTGPKVWYSRKRGIWIIPGYDEVRQALRDDEALSSAQSQARFRVRLQTMNAQDPPVHTRLRRSVSRAFTPRAMKAWEVNINRVADELVDEMITRGRVEIVNDLAKPLPNRLITMMLAIPQEDRHQFLEWADTINEAAFAPLTPRGMALNMRSSQAVIAMHRSLDPMIKARRAAPGDDLISMLAAPSGEDTLSDDEVFWSASMLVGAGSETTTNLISGLFLTLAQRPDVYARLREHPELIPAAIEEQLRLVSPVQGFYRTATRDYRVGDHTIPAGARVLVLYAAGNRDPAHYPDPDTFDLDRNPTDHLAFGGGAHYCLGTHLTRIEVGRVLTQMIPRVKEIRLAGEHRYLVNATMRGLEHLPVELVLAEAGADGAAAGLRSTGSR
ncbi:cytochrome P450 [Mycolicibacter kumamotonensis]|jgi:cytochrome P450|uniref:Cytochrome P450 n=1 Tax=Mycolicibacter kumamotonensis TaxID=354243 RepID=A0A1B8S9N9_9MYCO|nr:cytochrome P450 [Mycolicibacter kumamotonensis]OBY29386.1 cytochrome P450 [Mycolicibacter kumamotonensis]ORA83441.1 cytochrome P450 [Mycolicibacter kumamotonensis]